MNKAFYIVPFVFFLFSCQNQKSDLEILKENSCLPLGGELESMKNSLEFEERRQDEFNVYSIKADKLYEGRKTYIYFNDEGECIGLLTRNPFYGFNVFGLGIHDSFYSQWYPQKDKKDGWHVLANKYKYYEGPLENAKNEDGEVWYGATNRDETIQLNFSIDFSGREYNESMGCIRALEVIVSER